MVYEDFSKISQAKVWLKSEENNGYFTWRPVYIFDNISLTSSYNGKCLEISTENQNTNFIFINFFPKTVPFML